MGCDSDLPDGKEIIMPNGDRRKRCPRSGSHSVHRYVTAHGWREKGSLSHIFPPDDTPYSMIEAFNIIDSTYGEIKEWRGSKS